jgi:hypothetical protein
MFSREYVALQTHQVLISVYLIGTNYGINCLNLQIHIPSIDCPIHMEFYTNVTFKIKLGAIVVLSLVSVYAVDMLVPTYAINYDNQGEDNDLGNEKIDQTLQQDDISNTPRPSHDTSTFGCDMDALDNFEKFPSCQEDEN